MFCRTPYSVNSRDEFRAVCVRVPHEVKVMFVSIKLELLNSEPTIIPREVLCFCALCFVLCALVFCVFFLLD